MPVWNSTGPSINVRYLKRAILLVGGLALALLSGKAQADHVQELKQQLAQNQLTAALIVNGGLLTLPLVIILQHQIKALKEEINEEPWGGSDPVYGMVSPLGSNPGNDVAVLALGYGSEVTAAGWSDIDAGASHAIRWTLSGGTQDLGALGGCCGGLSYGYAISADGSTVVGVTDVPNFDQFHAFRWTQSGGMQDIGTLTGAQAATIAYATNLDGSVVVGQADNGHAFRWTQANGMQDLGTLGACCSTAFAVSADGSVIVGTATVSNGQHVFRWTQANGMQDLGTLSGLNYATATGVSADGKIVVGYASSTSGIGMTSEGWSLGSGNSPTLRPFRWTAATGMQDLNTVLANAGVNTSGTTLSTAVSITADGTAIGGSGTFPDTQSQYVSGFVAKVCDATNAAACAKLNGLAGTHDFNADGKSDILWRDAYGDGAIWEMSGGTILGSASLGNVPTNWSLVGTRDFNGDGFPDLLWRDTAGDVWVWLMGLSGTNVTVSQSSVIGNEPTTWSVAGTGDFNADGKGDILWHDTSGNLKIWFMNGFAISEVPITNVPTIWSVAGVGDFNGDGKSDILWHDIYGDVSIWEMSGGTILAGSGLGNIPTNWSIVGTGDFNGDGTSDIVWRDTAGDVLIQLITNATLLQQSVLGNVPTTWSITETGDFNGDGKSDILWLDTSGNVMIWFMNGLAVSAVNFGNVGTLWSIQGTNAD